MLLCQAVSILLQAPAGAFLFVPVLCDFLYNTARYAAPQPAQLPFILLL